MKLGKEKSSATHSDSGKSSPGAPASSENNTPPKEAAAISDERLVPVSAAEEVQALEETPSVAAPRDEAAQAAGVEEAVSEDPQEKLRKLTEENARLFDQLLRKQAEFENFRKRTEKEKAEFVRYASFEMVRELLPALDGFERALRVETSEGMEGFRKGMELIYKQLLDVLKKAGLKPIESVGQIFDPNFHQAVAYEEHEGSEDHQIIEEFQRGYLFQGRLMRASMVKVAQKKKSAEIASDDSESGTISIQ